MMTAEQSLFPVVRELRNARNWCEPVFAPADPKLVLRHKVGRSRVQTADHDLGFFVAEVHDSGTASNAKAPARKGTQFATTVVCIAWPDREGAESRTRRLPAIEAVAQSDAQRLAANQKSYRTAETSAFAHLVHGSAPVTAAD
jgi:hypothetical protein